MCCSMMMEKNREGVELPSGDTEPKPTPSSRPFDDAVAHLQTVQKETRFELQGAHLIGAATLGDAIVV